MIPSRGRLIDAIDHLQIPVARTALVVACRPRKPSDRPAPDRGKASVYPEDGYVLDLRVFGLTPEEDLSVHDPLFAPAQLPMPAPEEQPGWLWSWPERV